MRAEGQFKRIALTRTKEDVDRMYEPWDCPHCGAGNRAGVKLCVKCMRHPGSDKASVEAPVSRFKRPPR